MPGVWFIAKGIYAEGKIWLCLGFRLLMFLIFASTAISISIDIVILMQI
ncbi:MAG: hypothetical protein F6K40_34760 [Okeania sp. SIO3I5]|nr:hypothetical protein [Okeania sp. SIO3I5]NEQ41097.1 hypothetical protein [Okeania sp. SIO3I5]